MPTLVANRPVDLNGPEAAARQHAQAVVRNYISQPRLSECHSLLIHTANSRNKSGVFLVLFSLLLFNMHFAFDRG